MRKHAAAQHVTVYLDFAAAAITLEVLDDGVGFDPLSVSAAGRGGLRTIAERTARISGTLTYESMPGEGTRVKVEVTL